jgi:hypothetical protein
MLLDVYAFHLERAVVASSKGRLLGRGTLKSASEHHGACRDHWFDAAPGIGAPAARGWVGLAAKPEIRARVELVEVQAQYALKAASPGDVKDSRGPDDPCYIPCIKYKIERLRHPT